MKKDAKDTQRDKDAEGDFQKIRRRFSWLTWGATLGIPLALLWSGRAQAGLKEQLKGVQSLVVEDLAPLVLCIIAILGGSVAGHQGKIWHGIAVFSVIMMIGLILGMVTSGELMKIGAHLAGTNN